MTVQCSESALLGLDDWTDRVQLLGVVALDGLLESDRPSEVALLDLDDRTDQIRLLSEVPLDGLVESKRLSEAALLDLDDWTDRERLLGKDTLDGLTESEGGTSKLELADFADFILPFTKTQFDTLKVVHFLNAWFVRRG